MIIRGIGKQILFEDDKDRICFLGRMGRFSIETEVGVCAYCLMENHVHMLLHDKDNLTQLFMKKIGVSYAKYFNKRYERTGHLFQDRYKSENIYDEKYFLTVLRYILRNPDKAGICRAADYKWSSYRLYGSERAFIDQTFMTRLFGSKEEFIRFVSETNDDECLEYDYKKNDEWAKEIIRKKLGITSGTVLQGYSRGLRDEALKYLKKAGLSIRQIERLTGINRGAIQKA